MPDPPSPVCLIWCRATWPVTIAATASANASGHTTTCAHAHTSEAIANPFVRLGWGPDHGGAGHCAGGAGHCPGVVVTRETLLRRPEHAHGRTGPHLDRMIFDCGNRVEVLLGPLDDRARLHEELHDPGARDRAARILLENALLEN